MLPAHIEIHVATGDITEARTACDELSEIARRQGSEALAALAAQAEGAVALVEGDAASALAAARHAWGAWQELGAPYDAARARVLIAQACAVLGDEDMAALELNGARDAFFRLGAAPDLTRLDSMMRKHGRRDHGLTARELEVLRLVARGNSNREIASSLVISERTVARHMRNLFAKLRVSSRASASVFAAEHDLL